MKNSIGIALVGVTFALNIFTADASEGNTLRGVALKSYALSPSAGGLMMMGKFTLVNTNKFAVKDFLIECEIFAESGTKVSTASEKVLKLVAGNKSRTLTEVNMGFVPKQIARYSCYLRDFETV